MRHRNGIGTLQDIDGTEGADRLRGTSEDDRIDADAGNDRVKGGGGNDDVRGEDGDDILFGDGGRDEVRGGDGNDRLDGGNGSDSLRGEDGDDVIRTGAGRDIVQYETGDDNDVVADFEDGRDRLDLRDFNFTDFAQVEALADQVGNNVVIEFAPGQTLTLADFQLEIFDSGDVILA